MLEIKLFEIGDVFLLKCQTKKQDTDIRIDNYNFFYFKTRFLFNKAFRILLIYRKKKCKMQQ